MTRIGVNRKNKKFSYGEDMRIDIGGSIRYDKYGSHDLPETNGKGGCAGLNAYGRKK